MWLYVREMWEVGIQTRLRWVLCVFSNWTNQISLLSAYLLERKEKAYICGKFLLLPCLCLFVLIVVFFSSLPMTHSICICSILNLKTKNKEWLNTNNEVMHVTQILFFHYPKDNTFSQDLKWIRPIYTYIHIEHFTLISFFLDLYQNFHAKNN